MSSLQVYWHHTHRPQIPNHFSKNTIIIAANMGGWGENLASLWENSEFSQKWLPALHHAQTLCTNCTVPSHFSNVAHVRTFIFRWVGSFCSVALIHSFSDRGCAGQQFCCSCCSSACHSCAHKPHHHDPLFLPFPHFSVHFPCWAPPLHPRSWLGRWHEWWIAPKDLCPKVPCPNTPLTPPSEMAPPPPLV